MNGCFQEISKRTQLGRVENETKQDGPVKALREIMEDRAKMNEE
jgi:hypothetical protein